MAAAAGLHKRPGLKFGLTLAAIKGAGLVGRYNRQLALDRLQEIIATSPAEVRQQAMEKLLQISGPRNIKLVMELSGGVAPGSALAEKIAGSLRNFAGRLPQEGCEETAEAALARADSLYPKPAQSGVFLVPVKPMMTSPVASRTTGEVTDAVQKRMVELARLTGRSLMANQNAAPAPQTE